ncbi:MAG: 1-acyl-sn-glycerol-3-phosphate acyltransferase [Treponemataceae bacterium]|nr:1-acyl-sn-glycerol-3-phosphate acyltransferase [Treponemataceae bacterium]
MLLWRISLYSTILLTLASIPFVGFDSAARILAVGCILVGAYLAVSLLIWLLLILICWTIPLDKEYEKPSKGYYKVFNAGYSYLCRLAGARIHVSGLEKVPFDKPFLFVSNHRSKFDNMVESVALKKSVIAFITKPENFKIPIGRHYMKRSCYLPIDRDNPRVAMETIIKASDMLKNGVCSVGVFPEGTRGDGTSLLDLKPGCFKIALKAKCPVVVGTIRGTEMLHKHFPFRRTDIYFDIVKVLSEKELENIKTVQIADDVRNLMETSLSKAV